MPGFGGLRVRGRRRRIVVALAVLALAGAAVAPSIIAQRYVDGPGGAHVGLARADQGWRFLYDAVRLSRGARLGTAERAFELARGEVWRGPPAIPESVELVYLAGPFEVPVPPGGAAPAPQRRVATPGSRLGWVVTGSVRGGPPQVIGLLDYVSGRVAWDIRPLPDGGSR